MPKEIAHLAMAQKVLAGLPEDSLFYNAGHQFLDFFLYGAIAPDTCFYYILGPNRSCIQMACRPFHVSGRGALMPVLEFLDGVSGREPEALAFAAGICSHLIADTRFHPLVYYFSGSDDIHDGATARHRMFETAMDVHFAVLFPKETVRFPHQVFSRIEIQNDGRLSFLKRMLCQGDPLCRRHLPYAFKSHKTACRIFSNHSLYRFFCALKRIGIDLLPDTVEALFYPFEKPVRLKFFDRALEYMDPETGEAYCERIETLALKAVDDTLFLLSVIEAAIEEEGRLANRIFRKKLPEIRPCPPLDKQSFLYWKGRHNLRYSLYG